VAPREQTEAATASVPTTNKPLGLDTAEHRGPAPTGCGDLRQAISEEPHEHAADMVSDIMQVLKILEGISPDAPRAGPWRRPHHAHPPTPHVPLTTSLSPAAPAGYGI
jgi:hypothetical protein